MTQLLLCLAASILLVTAICAAVRICNLDHVDLKANVWKLVGISFSVKAREAPKNARKRPPARGMGSE